MQEWYADVSGQASESTYLEFDPWFDASDDFIKEKEKSYVDAATHYQAAFKMSNNKNAGVGYRLAFNLLKAERYTETIDIGRQVLSAFPDFPQIKTDLMSKARANFR